MKMVFTLNGLDCANCAAKIERKVAALPGVEGANVNFLTQRMTIVCDDALATQVTEQATAAAKTVDGALTVRRIG